MSTERKSPDTILELTNLTPSNISYIQDDPDSPDGNWLTGVSNNADSVCRVSFPTPIGNPTQGIDLQQFKIWVRKTLGQTGTPAVRIELYENGGLLATILADTDVTSDAGQLFSATWNANLLSTTDGSLVECRIYGMKAGGALGARATVEIGAVEWNVEYSTIVIVEGSAQGSGLGLSQLDSHIVVFVSVNASGIGTSVCEPIFEITAQIDGQGIGSVETTTLVYTTAQVYGSGKGVASANGDIVLPYIEVECSGSGIGDGKSTSIIGAYMLFELYDIIIDHENAIEVLNERIDQLMLEIGNSRRVISI